MIGKLLEGGTTFSFEFFPPKDEGGADRLFDHIQKLEGLLSSEKDWKNFQNTYFPGNHIGSASRIIDRIEDNHARAQKSSNNKK